MNLLHSTRPKPSRDRSRLLILSLLLSLGLHLLVLLTLIHPLLQQENAQSRQQQPTRIHLVDLPVKPKKPQPQKPAEFEIDQQPLKQQPKIPVESFRKADRDQQVDRELAPEGEDVRDQTTQRPIATLLPRQEKKITSETQQKSAPENTLEKPRQAETKTLKKKAKKTAKKTATTATKPVEKQQKPLPILTPEQLRPSQSTLDQIALGSQGSRNRIKERKDVEVGDTVWLNLQHNLLVSFFRRFHNQIELVWNYPTQAATNGIEGTLELLITVDNQGELIDVDLRRTSGSDLLDFEAIQAVYRAAPFGSLTKHYPHEQLKIRAHFSYRITGQYIYGRRN